MAPVALFALLKGKPLSEEDKKLSHEIVFSGRLCELSKTERAGVKKSISESMRYVKAYTGPF